MCLVIRMHCCSLPNLWTYSMKLDKIDQFPSKHHYMTWQSLSIATYLKPSQSYSIHIAEIVQYIELNSEFRIPGSAVTHHSNIPQPHPSTHPKWPMAYSLASMNPYQPIYHNGICSMCWYFWHFLVCVRYLWHVMYLVYISGALWVARPELPLGYIPSSGHRRQHLHPSTCTCPEKLNAQHCDAQNWDDAQVWDDEWPRKPSATYHLYDTHVLQIYK